MKMACDNLHALGPKYTCSFSISLFLGSSSVPSSWLKRRSKIQKVWTVTLHKPRIPLSVANAQR